ncbi:UDP-N-acetylglucosamine 1-carboxyvinyltransferase [Desulfoscipio geothermicus]|uniref:UDP-N-acetylglucosamine 1-carboxyvinyltransferase n=1 Tax=Desulfoscipio geothermicus DSM 3669 TaxID=1121426 RepID=A0A1I6CXH8_9FIRM|nr:UDP-N-acetylglucosamine 1-carboxyvinyltransferase [Desulfoscipio geothermicus]SFQ97918.1 UDP-N-acetylglucosamine 1-carboxyvinyltransferase [Desulfoscipio geothermicus DSM 3669]
MKRLIIRGGRPLRGKVRVSGAKNAVLPIIAACLLPSSPCTLEDIPDLADVNTICLVLEHLGARVKRSGSTLVIHPPEKPATEAPYELVRRMRASFLVMGPLLARAGRAAISLPGGCAIGSRPIDLHLKGFHMLGARVEHGYGCIQAVTARGGLRGNRIYLDFPSVGATENIIMAAVLANGQTVIENAAEEPEVVDLANFLNAMGARIKGAGTKVIRITGVNELQGATHTVIPDRIEAGTFMVAASITGGDILVDNVIVDHVKPVMAKLQEMGIAVCEENGGVRVTGREEFHAVDVKTMPYPGFPTDMQAQMMALLAVARGTAIVTETVFENRFMHVNELRRMGARIKTVGRNAVVQGPVDLSGAPVNATDLRAGAALVLAGLRAEGETEISNVYHIERGYEHLVEKLRNLGVDIYSHGDGA